MSRKRIFLNEPTETGVGRMQKIRSRNQWEHKGRVEGRTQICHKPVPQVINFPHLDQKWSLTWPIAVKYRVRFVNMLLLCID